MHLEMGFREDQPKLDPGKYGWIREEKSKSLTNYSPGKR